MNKNDYNIRLEQPADYAEVENLVRESVRACIEADDGRRLPIMTMGPICIANDLKRQGYGKSLLDYSIEKAKEMGAGASFFLCKELIPGYLAGITGEYGPPAGYLIDEAKAEEFDKQYPYKEKLKLPGQLVYNSKYTPMGLYAPFGVESEK